MQSMTTTMHSTVKKTGYSMTLALALATLLLPGWAGSLHAEGSGGACTATGASSQPRAVQCAPLPQHGDGQNESVPLKNPRLSVF